MRHDSAVGAVVAGKYRVDRVLGQGGMGIVYEAQNLVLGRRVALKRLKDAARHDAALVTRFLQEARAAAAIGHDHIVDILDVVTDDSGVVWIVMELLAGESLAARLGRDRRLPAALAVEVIAQTLEALQAAHERGIVHRDLKPENLWLVSRPDGQPFVKLLDFGISKVLDLSLQVSSDKLTDTGVMMGTAHYMSPEQARGAATVDHRTDLWSAGALLFECLAGRTPFEESNYNAMIGKLLTEEPPNLLTLAPDVPAHVAAVVRRALTKDVAGRFGTASEMRAALLGEAAPAAEAPAPRVRIDSDPAGAHVPSFGLADTRIDPRTPAPTPFGAESTPPRATPRTWTTPVLLVALLVVAAVAAVGALGPRGTHTTGGVPRERPAAPPAPPPRPAPDAGAAREPTRDAAVPLSGRTLRVTVTRPARGSLIVVGAEERAGPSATFTLPPGEGAVAVLVTAPGHQPRRLLHDPTAGELVVSLERVTGSGSFLDEKNPYRRRPAR